jgi:hypothetical protein
MKRILISLLFIAPLLQMHAQDTKPAGDPKPHFAAIHFAPVFESIQKLKTGYGTSLEGAYFLNEWFGVGGIIRYSMHPYSYTNFKSSGDAGQLAFSANAYIRKVYLNEKLSILPSIGLGFTSTSFPKGTLTQTESRETSPGVYSAVDTTIAINALNVTSFMYNILSLDVNYQFKPNMSVGVKFDYHISVSSKWPDETMGDFFSIGIGYAYSFGLK